MSSFEQVKQRSGDRCEAMVKAGGTAFTRCWSRPVEVHHMLTRSRGGKILDAAGETAHLIALCPQHHRMAHAGGETGLMIDGYISTGQDGRPVYQGSDPRLARYRTVDLPEMPEEVPGDEPSQRLRGPR